MFARSIKDNIFYGTNNVQGNFTDADVEEAAKNANIHSFVNSLPKVEILKLLLHSFYKQPGCLALTRKICPKVKQLAKQPLRVK